MSLGSLVSKAQDSSRRPGAAFGRLTIHPRFIHWVNKTALDVDQGEWERLPEGEKSIELTLSVHLQELNPTAPYATHDRKVTVGSADWFQTFLPSLEGVYGAEAVENNLPECIDKLENTYVETEDVPQKRKGQAPDAGGKVYHTLRIVRVFPDETSCLEAYNERWGSTAGNVTTSSAAPTNNGMTGPLAAAKPGEYTNDDWEVVVESIKQMLSDNPEATPASIASDIGVPLINVSKVMRALKESTPVQENEIPF